MEKIRVYELARELDTNSKRLMEKLAEINIVVKNHMSLLEEQDLDQLYKHIGVKNFRTHSQEIPVAKVTAQNAVPETEAKPDEKPASHNLDPAGLKAKKETLPEVMKEEKKEIKKDIKKDTKKEIKKEIKSAPRIIRTTEIILDDEKSESAKIQAPIKRGPRQNQRQQYGGDRRPSYHNEYVKSSDSNTGLMAGYTRSSREKTIEQLIAEARQNALKNPVQQKPDTTAIGSKRSETGVKTNQAEEKVVTASVGETVENSVKTERKAEEKQVTQQVQQITEPITITTEVKKSSEQAENRNVEIEVIKATDKAVSEPEKATDNLTNEVQDKTRMFENSTGQIEKAKETAASEVNMIKAPSERKESSETTPSGGTERSEVKTNYTPHQTSDRSRTFDSQQSRPNTGYGNRPDSRPYTNRTSRTAGDYSNRPQQTGRDGSSVPYQGNRPQTSRDGSSPPYQGNRPQTSRDGASATYQGGRPMQNRDGRPYSSQAARPPYNKDGRPPYTQGAQGNRPQTRPSTGGSSNYQGTRPPFAQGQRPQQTRTDGRPFVNKGDRPYGDRQQGSTYNKPGQQRPGQVRTGARSVDIPKPELFTTKNDEFASSKNEQKREFMSKDKEVKKDVKRDGVKPAPQQNKNKKFKPHASIIGEKKDVHQIMDDEFILNEFYNASDDIKRKRLQKQKRAVQKEKFIPPRAILTSITIPEALTVKELAESLKKTSSEVIKKLLIMGTAATINEVLDFDTATIIAGEFGITTEKLVVIHEEDILFDDSEVDAKELEPRPPVVVVMGHVDHGKTSLLDAIRKTNVISNEAGGITQHIGAYMVNINGKAITFLDTPGHEAFTTMRARGAMVTDVAILVVAADDGVMPQTIEAINHAKAAKVSIIVAINKIDKEGADPERVKQELTEYGLVVEEWGGDVIAVPVSAKKGENIDQLLEMVLLTADIMELKASPTQQAKGTVIEAKLDKSRGPVATLLVQRGTVHVGDSFITGATIGRIRAMLNDKGEPIRSAGPSTPIEITGISEVPAAGEVFYVTSDEKVAKSLVEKRKQLHREEQLKSSAKVTLDDLFTQIQEGKIKDLNLIIKADVQGSVEAVRQSLEKLGNDEVRISIIHGGVGAINESDVSLANVSNAIIIGFNVRPGGAAVIEAAESNGVDMRLYTVIYNAIEDIQAAMKGMLDPTYREVVLGHVEIRQIFKASGVGTIGGCYVLDGKIQRGNSVRLLRNGVVIHEGKMASLKRFKDDAKEVLQGFECGIALEKYNDIKENDIIEPYTMEEVPVE